MPIVAFVSSKGGVGKTTIASAVAVVAAASATVELIDLDPQQSLAAWWRLRASDNPSLADARTYQAKGKGRPPAGTWVVVDTPNARLDIMREWIGRADVVVEIIRPGAFDLASIVSTEKIIKEQKAIEKTIRVLNDFEPKVAFHNEVLGYLGGQHGKKPHVVQHRAVYGSATATGSTAVEGNRAAKEEVAKLWQAIETLAAARS